jgi:hypothetical protein
MACVNFKLHQSTETERGIMIRRTLASSLMAACLLGTLHSALAQEGQTALPGALKIGPFADVRAVYDDNIDSAAENEIDDTFYDATAGLALQYSGSILEIKAGAFVSRRMYTDLSDKDFTARGQDIMLRYGSRDRIEIEASQAFRRISDDDPYGPAEAVAGISPDSAVDAASRRERNIIQAAIRAGKDISDKTELDVSYRFDAVDYQVEDLLNLRTQTAMIEGASKMTDKSSGLLILKGGIQDIEVTGVDADFFSASLGAKTQGTDKLELKASAGFQQYNRPDDTINSLVYSLESTFALTDKVSLQLGGRNGTQLSTVLLGNGTEYQSAWIGGSFRATDVLKLSANLAYREDEYLDPVTVDNGLVERTDKGTAIRIRADYQTPAEILRLYAETSFETVDSNVSESDTTRVMLGLRMEL